MSAFPMRASKLSAFCSRNQNGAWREKPEFFSIVLMRHRASGHSSHRAAIMKWVRQREEEIAKDLAELVAIPTENPPGNNYGTCAKILEKHIRKAGLKLKLHSSSTQKETASDKSICLLTEYGRGDRTLYFHGHYDVVPAQSAKQFKPLRKKHFLFGRGSCDMKGGIVAMLYAIRALKTVGAELRGKIGLTLVPDEETGGKRGSAWLADQDLLGRSGIGMLLPEPTSGVVWNANRGAITFRIQVLGKSAHVGLQHRGENAFERMHRLVNRLLNLKSEVERRKTTHNTGAESGTNQRDKANSGALRNSILMLGGQSGGGSNFNVVPEKCWFTLDRRINPEEDLEEEKSRLIDLLKECRRDGIPLEWEILQEGRSAACREDQSLGIALSKSIEAVTGGRARFEMCPGLLETRFYAANGIPAYAYGPGLLSVAHGPNEYVDLRRVADCAAIYALTALEMLRS
jgi:succinyl-diaminopimelate desuccinylase